MYEPLISIVIPVYNGSNYLREAIESALSQSYKKREIIVINDGSKDQGKTQNIIDSFGDKIIGLKKENGGVATALNLGIEVMRGEYFAWLSHDDVLKKDALQIYVNNLQNQNKEIILYGNYDLIDSQSIIYNKVDFTHRFRIKQLENSVYPVINGCVNGCSCLIHKSHFARVGRFNETLKITQDNEMWFRIFRNQKILFIKEPLCSKRYHSEQDSVTKNVYPDEDLFICNCLKQISLKECACLAGGLCKFYLETRKKVADGRHPMSEEFCNDMIKNLIDRSLYEEMSKEEVIDLLVESNKDYKDLYEAYSLLQKKYASLFME